MLVIYRLSVCEETENKDAEIDIVWSVLIKYEVQEEIVACVFCSLCDEKSIIWSVRQKSVCKYATEDKVVSFRELTGQAM